MHKTEVFIVLQLPGDVHEKEARRSAIVNYLDWNPAFQNIMLLKPDGAVEAELSFSLMQEAGLDKAVSAITQSGAKITRFFLQLPSSLSGIANVYDARDAGSEIGGLLEEIEGVKEAAVRNNGAVHIECDWQHADKILKQATEALSKNKEEMQEPPKTEQ